MRRRFRRYADEARFVVAWVLVHTLIILLFLALACSGVTCRRNG